MISLTPRQFAREKADTLGCIGNAIDASGGCATVDLFLVKRRWQITPYVHRYPSPVGRLGRSPRQAPDFLFLLSEHCGFGQGPAQNAALRKAGWNRTAYPGVLCSNAATCKGAETWTSPHSKRHGSQRCARSWGWPHAVTRLVNRRSAAVSSGLAFRPQRAAMSQRAQLSAQRAMLPSVRPTRPAADASPNPYSRISTARAARLGGLFYAIATDLSAGQEKTKRKGHTCSTRS